MKILFETERTIVREWEKKDYLDLYEYASMDEFTKFLSFPTYKTKQEAISHITDVRGKYKTELYNGDWAIELKAENKVIGSLKFSGYTPKIEGKIEVAYGISPKYQHRGIATEVLKASFSYLKSLDIVKRIVCVHDVLNKTSGAVMQRAGMTFEGIMRRAGRNNLHSRADFALYSILYEEIE